MKTLSLTILATLCALLASPRQLLGAVTSKDLARFLPDKLGEFTSTEKAKQKDEEQAGGKYHWAQRVYIAADQSIAACAAISRGSEVRKNLDSLFSKHSHVRVAGFEGVVVTPAKPASAIAGSSSCYVTLKLREDQMITLALMGSEKHELAVKLLEMLDLKKLAALGEDAPKAK